MNAIGSAQQVQEEQMIDSSVEAFVPSPENSRQFRSALGKFSTGVTIVTVNGEDGPLGMTVNSFASVSLDPPLILWSALKSSHRYKYYDAEARFAVHVLSSEQEWMAKHFARHDNSIDACDWQMNSDYLPIINNVVAHFECEKHASIDAGDHAIFIGRVTNATVCDKVPLVFSGGQFGTFAGATDGS